MRTSANQWYAIYTLSKHERKVEKLLQRQQIETFLPMHDVVRQWSDRKKKLSVPLFPNYLFVNTVPNEFWKVFSVTGVIKFVSCGRRPSPIASNIIVNIQKVLNGEVEVVQEKLKKGECVRVIDGPFEGVEGNFTSYRGKTSLVIELSLLRRSVLVEIDSTAIQKI